MNMKKVFAISLLFIALCSIGMVCAASVNNPEGFTINKDLAQNNQNGTFFGVPCNIQLLLAKMVLTTSP